MLLPAVVLASLASAMFSGFATPVPQILATAQYTTPISGSVSISTTGTVKAYLTGLLPHSNVVVVLTKDRTKYTAPSLACTYSASKTAPLSFELVTFTTDASGVVDASLSSANLAEVQLTLLGSHGLAIMHDQSLCPNGAPIAAAPINLGVSPVGKASINATSSTIAVPPLPINKKVTYIDQTSTSPTASQFAVNVTTDYNIINFSFWLTTGPRDAALHWTLLDEATRRSYLDAYHFTGKVIMVSAFGATENPTSDKLDPVQTAKNLAAFVKQYGFDGADIDYEDNEGMKIGGEAWLVTFTQQLRELLPRPQYIISHAPQAPTFSSDQRLYPNGGYIAVDKQVGALIDFYNVQFYNQGEANAYDTCTTLLTKSSDACPGTSLFEISKKGVPLSKLVIGKPAAQTGVQGTGYIKDADLATCVAQAKGMGWNAGIMGWNFELDPTGSWIKTVAAALNDTTPIPKTTTSASASKTVSVSQTAAVYTTGTANLVDLKNGSTGLTAAMVFTWGVVAAFFLA
ncbi:UNVERIFIED_CONTAM: hypothetical protein HDU68_001495 [Siphonaria sp. JEL0065]|nr:hypothetical protein HDU68_001495 [Siphonaria sp. JEL0065]